VSAHRGVAPQSLLLLRLDILDGRVISLVVRGDWSLAVRCLQKRKEKIRFKREICSGQERGRSPEYPRMLRPFLIAFYRPPQEKGIRQLKNKNQVDKIRKNKQANKQTFEVASLSTTECKAR